MGVVIWRIVGDGVIEILECDSYCEELAFIAKTGTDERDKVLV